MMKNNKSNNNRILSIITPAYNRAELLVNCYNSLVCQTNKDFEWIIIDDGSTDNTSEVVNSFINESPEMNITYCYKQNGGKHTALNESHKYIKGDYVLLLDSDDTLVENAVEIVLKEWSKYDSNASVGNVVFQKGRSASQPNAYCENPSVPVKFENIRLVNVYSNDSCEVCRAELFKKYPFPVFDGEKFLAEGILWARIGNESDYVYINEVIYLCEYLEGGLTKSGRLLRIRNSLGGMENANEFIRSKYNIKLRLKNALLYNAYGFFSYKKIGRILSSHDNDKFFKAVFILPGYMLYRHWKRKYKI